MAHTVNYAKIAIRKKIRSQISALCESNPNQVQAESQWVADSVRKLPQYQSAHSLACFVSMKGKEIDTDPLLRYCFEDKKRVYLPRVTNEEDSDMIMLRTFDFDEIRDVDRFTKSKWGIWEPNREYLDSTKGRGQKREDAMDTLDLDLMIVPGLGFNEKRSRLGQGCGFYDRYFMKYKAALFQKYKAEPDIDHDSKFPYLVGIGLSVNYNKHIPVEEHDWILDEVILPSLAEM